MISRNSCVQVPQLPTGSLQRGDIPVRLPLRLLRKHTKERVMEYCPGTEPSFHRKEPVTNTNTLRQLT